MKGWKVLGARWRAAQLIEDARAGRGRGAGAETDLVSGSCSARLCAVCPSVSCEGALGVVSLVLHDGVEDV